MIASHGNRRAFTILEAVMASSILTLVLWSGVVVSRVALDSMHDTSVVAERQALERRSDDSMGQWLDSASLNSLEAAPYYGEQVLEPMQEEMPYDNIAFRRVVGVDAKGPVLSPSPDLDPIRVMFVRRPGEELGDVWLVTSDAKKALVKDVMEANFIRVGNRIELFVMTSKCSDGGGYDGQYDYETRKVSFLLRTP